MAAPLELSFADLGELRAEYDAHLRRGRAFVSGVKGLPVLEDCQLVIKVEGHPEVHLGARVVMPVDQQAVLGGVGVSLHAGFEPLLASLLESEEQPASAEVAAPEAPAAPADGPDPSASQAGAEAAEAAEAEPPEATPDALATSPDVVDSPVTRLSRLTMAAKIKLIRKSQILSERNMLERMLGKSGWDALLQNPRLTIPEVARLAQKGTVPRPTLERIADNKAWVAAPPVRRALLRNPKLPRTSIADILRAVPRRELEQMVKGAAYPPAVRDAIRRMLGIKR